MVEYCDTLHIEREEKQGIQSIPKEGGYDVYSTIEKIAFGDILKKEPFRKRLLEKLKGSRDHYKIKIGEYRIGLKINKEEKIIEFRRASHRKDIYCHFP